MAQTLSEFAFSIADLEESDSLPLVPIITAHPADVFLVMASMLEASGAYSHFDPAPENEKSAYPPTFCIEHKLNEAAQNLGKKWRDALETADYYGIPDEILDRWTSLFRFSGHLPIRQNAASTNAPGWWAEALFLLIAADEAAVGFGQYMSDQVGEYSKFMHFDIFGKVRTPRDGSNDEDDITPSDSYRVANGSAASLSPYGCKEIVNVFPKLNVSETGCSHRNFSRNLTLLPKTGTVRCHWHIPQAPLKSEIERTVDIVLVPYPYKFPAKTFTEAGFNHYAHDALRKDSDRNWANFKVNQGKYQNKSDLKQLVISLVNSANEDVESVNGVILPEYSTNFEEFLDISTDLKSTIAPDLEFFVAGTSDNCEGNLGNHVVTSIWSEVAESDVNSANQRFSIISSRRKHHRWMLSKDQIDTYGLSSALDPRINWWENHVSGFRELHFYPFREHSLFTTMICEDMARIDPCHEVLKSVGPNIVFSLLMDGPQLRNRWPGRYASSISDDIGCSVLTATSYGLIDRANHAGLHQKNDTVAFFASPFGSREITLPYSSGARGVLLSLTSENVGSQNTIDGRKKPRRVWRLASVRPLIP